jgi:hypothetical protein
MTEHYSNQSIPSNLHKAIFKLLDSDALLTAKPIFKLLNLPYKQYKNYVTKTRCEWKYYPQNERGSICSDSHRCRYVGVVLGSVSRGEAVLKGWVLSRARNRFLVFREGLGRVVWYETGRLLLNVRKPANEGRAKQLFCDAFFRTGLISDVKVLDACLGRIHVRGAHSVFKSNQRLPRMVIDTFADSHGVLIKLGDRSHPSSVEVVWEVQEQVQRLGDLAEGFQRFMTEFHGLLNGANGNGKVKDLGEDYSR